MIDQILDHVSDALDRLRQQYVNSPNLAGLIAAFVNPIQDLENCSADLATLRTIDGSIGYQLDRFGSIVNITRNGGEGDTAYRIRIKGAIVQNISQGQPELVIQVLKLLTNSSLVVYQELYPAGVALTFDGTYTDQSSVNSLYEQVRLCLPAGIRCDYLGSIVPGDASFAFADANSTGLGFGDDLDPTMGGELAEHLYNQNMPFAFDGSDTSARGFSDNADIRGGGFFY